MQPFAEVYGKRGAILSAVDLVRGVGVLLGWDRIDVPRRPAISTPITPPRAATASRPCADHDLVCVHVEAPDEASHEGKADEKVKALEEIDRHIVGPLLEALPRVRRLAHPGVAGPSHAAADAGPCPRSGAVRHGRDRRSRREARPSYDEAVAAGSDLAFERGHELMTTVPRVTTNPVGAVLTGPRRVL